MIMVTVQVRLKSRKLQVESWGGDLVNFQVVLVTSRERKPKWLSGLHLCDSFSNVNIKISSRCH